MFDQYDGPFLAGRSRLRFHAMAKPIGSTCNLDCAYCYYLSKATLPDGPGTGRMSEEVLEEFIKQYIEGVAGDEVVFSWQGGEPTLRGLPFFEKVVALQQKYRKPGQRIENDLQTNGVLLDDDWAKFLKANRFLVGLSIGQALQRNIRPTLQAFTSPPDFTGWVMGVDPGSGQIRKGNKIHHTDRSL